MSNGVKRPSGSSNIPEMIVVAGDVTTDRFFLREPPEGRFEAARDSLRKGLVADRSGGALLISKILSRLTEPLADDKNPEKLAERLEEKFRDQIADIRRSDPKLSFLEAVHKIDYGVLQDTIKATIEASPEAEVFFHEVRIGQRIPAMADRYQQLYELGPFRAKPGSCSEDGSSVLRISGDLGFSHPKHTSNQPTGNSFVNLPPDADKAGVVVINDSGLGFREKGSNLESLCHYSPPHLVVRHVGPILAGNTWEGVRKNKYVLDNKIVIVNIDDLEGRGIRISRDLSWERAVEDICFGLWHNNEFGKLRAAAHIIVTFGRAGTLHLYRKSEALTPDYDHRKNFKVKLYFHATVADRTDIGGETGRMIGTTALLTASIAHAISYAKKQIKPRILLESDKVAYIIDQAIVRAHWAMDKLYASGFGDVKAWPEISFPYDACVSDLYAGRFPVSAKDYCWETIDHSTISVELSKRIFNRNKPLDKDIWSFVGALDAKQTYRLAEEILSFGVEIALRQHPHAKIGKLTAVDRTEVESYRAVLRIIRAYCQSTSKKPISLAAFGKPGNGKSFGLQEIIKQVSKETKAELEPITFNLSQFQPESRDEQLRYAFHKIRDVSLSGKMPVVFWDEFDVDNYSYLSQFLSPMQDGTFVEGAMIHPIGRAIFIFIGGVNETMAQFERLAGDSEMETLAERRRVEPVAGSKQEDPPTAPQIDAKSVKLPDFISRLRGYVDIRDLNPELSTKAASQQPDNGNVVHLLRRAILLRSFVEKNYPHLIAEQDGLKVAQIDREVVRAFLLVKEYKHGARSMEAILATSQTDLPRLTRSCLPPETVLKMHVNAKDFLSISNGYPATSDCKVTAERCYEGIKAACEAFNIKNVPEVHSDEWTWMIEGVQDFYPEYVSPKNGVPTPEVVRALIRIWKEAYRTCHFIEPTDQSWLHSAILLSEKPLKGGAQVQLKWADAAISVNAAFAHLRDATNYQ